MPTIDEEKQRLVQPQIAADQISFFAKLFHGKYNHTLIRQISAGCYNVVTLSLYLFSANYFPEHISRAHGIPPEIKKAFGSTPIHDLQEKWHLFALPVCGLATLALLLTNQRSMPARLNKMFAWETNEQAEPTGFKKKYIIIESSLAAFWKSIVSSTSFWALLGGIPFIGFWPGLGITLLFFPGQFAGQNSQFLEPFFKKLGVIEMPSYMRKIAGGYAALGYTLPGEALYGNTWFYGLDRIGLRISAHSLRIFINITNLLLNLNYGYNTLTQYYLRIVDLIGSSNKSATKDEINGAINSENETRDDINTHQSKLSQRMPIKGNISAFYKTIATLISTLGMGVAAASLLDLDPEINTIAIFVTFAALLQAPNYLIQTTFYAHTEKYVIEHQGNTGIFGVMNTFKNYGGYLADAIGKLSFWRSSNQQPVLNEASTSIPSLRA